MKKERTEFESVKIRRDTYNILKNKKEKEGVSISWFIEKAVEEKLQRDKK